MGHFGTLQLAAPLLLLLVFVFFMAADSLHTAVHAQEELALPSNRLGGVASYEPRGFESSTDKICDGSLGMCNIDDEEEFMMGSAQAHGRLLRRVRYYIGYEALAANRVPCRPRSGRPYYTQDCYRATGPVRPYHRSCTAITRCKRYTS